MELQPLESIERDLTLEDFVEIVAGSDEEEAVLRDIADIHMEVGFAGRTLEAHCPATVAGLDKELGIPLDIVGTQAEASFAGRTLAIREAHSPATETGLDKELGTPLDIVGTREEVGFAGRTLVRVCYQGILRLCSAMSQAFYEFHRYFSVCRPHSKKWPPACKYDRQGRLHPVPPVHEKYSEWWNYRYLNFREYSRRFLAPVVQAEILDFWTKKELARKNNPATV